MRIVFMGTPEFAVPSLRVLLEHHYEIPAVVTAPDKPRGRGQQVSFSPVKSFALVQKLPILQPEQLNDPSFVQQIAALKPDLIAVVAFRILPKDVCIIPRCGSFNLHASLLPKYRGAAPIHWAIINGETETGVTTFFLEEKVDTGNMILQARVRIGPDETAGELHDKLAAVGAEVVLQTVRLIELGKAIPRSQDDRLATPAPKIFKNDCKIDWTKSAQQVHNVVRGLSPTPCAWTTHAGTQLKIYRTAIDTTQRHIGDAKRGEIVRAEKDRLLVKTGDGVITIREIQQEGRKRMGVEEFLRGYSLRAGDRFE
jgi:methionyl-tRNA formyltransferase